MSTKIIQQEFINRANKKHNYKYDYTSTIYLTTHEKVIITCPIHGNFMQSPANHLSGKGCTKCKYIIISDKAKLNSEDFIFRCKAIWGNRFDYSKSEYCGNATKVIIRCNKHNIEFKQTPVGHYIGVGCSLCLVRSKGEEAITKWLVCNKINYEIEKRFSTCKIGDSKSCLRFDFYLIDFNLLIEYDGKQHYKQGDIWNKNKYSEFEKIKLRDEFKNKWAKDNGYNLLRIPYFKFKDIDSILNFNIRGVSHDN